jgi:hypothetical protein
MTPQDLFHNNPLLTDLPADHVRELLRYAVVKTYAAGAVVIGRVTWPMGSMVF